MPDDAKPLIDADKMYAKLLEVGEAFADCKAAYHALDNASKSVLADLTQGYRDNGAAGSIVAAETMALRAQTYKDHLASVAVAHKNFLRAQVKYDSLCTLIELRRSEEASRRQEMKL